MSKKIYNFNAMRPVIVIAHNAPFCNSKAINKEMVLGAGIDINYFYNWTQDVKKLYRTVCDYVDAKHSPKNDEEQAKATEAARNKIFPAWKTVLATGEAKKDKIEMRVSEYDIDSLVGYAEKFMASGVGTMQAHQTEQIFRKNVEALVGCKMAMNEVLTDDERDTLDEYNSAKKTLASLNESLDTIAEEREALVKLLDYVKDEPKFKAHVENDIKDLDDKRLTVKDDIRKTIQRISDVELKAKNIEAKMNVLK